MIGARGLKRTYMSRGKTIEAVKGIDLKVDAGEIVGFLGPNGAGKTTTLKMLCTLLEPTGGSATVAGSISGPTPPYATDLHFALRAAMEEPAERSSKRQRSPRTDAI
jgi:ABC-type multidrug transport system ATPase subunit